MKHFFQCRFELLNRNSLENLAADRLIRAKTTSHKYVVAFDGLATNFNFRSQQSDVAHIMLSAGVGTPCQMNVQRLIEDHALLEVIGDFQGMAFGICRGKFAVGIPGARNEPASQMRLPPIQTNLNHGFLHRLDVCVRNVWQDQILPDCETNLARAIEIGDLGQTQQLFGSDLPDWHCHAEVIQAALFLREYTDVRMRHWRGGTRLFEWGTDVGIGWRSRQFRSEQPLCFGEKFFE